MLLHVQDDLKMHILHMFKALFQLMRPSWCISCDYRSGLEQDDMRILYKYLTTSLFPSYQDQELTPGGNSGNPSGMIRHSASQTSSSMHYGK